MQQLYRTFNSEISKPLLLPFLYNYVIYNLALSKLYLECSQLAVELLLKSAGVLWRECHAPCALNQGFKCQEKCFIRYYFNMVLKAFPVLQRFLYIRKLFT